MESGLQSMITNAELDLQSAIPILSLLSLILWSELHLCVFPWWLLFPNLHFLFWSVNCGGHNSLAFPSVSSWPLLSQFSICLYTYHSIDSGRKVMISYPCITLLYYLGFSHCTHKVHTTNGMWRQSKVWPHILLCRLLVCCAGLGCVSNHVFVLLKTKWW